MSGIIQRVHSLGYWGINPPAYERGKTILQILKEIKQCLNVQLFHERFLDSKAKSGNSLFLPFALFSSTRVPMCTGKQLA